MESVGPRAGSLVMVDLLGDRFTGALAHPGAECAVPSSAEAWYRLSHEL